MEKSKKLAITSAFGYSFIFGFSFIFTKVGLGIMTAMELISYRFLLAALVLTILRIFKIIKINLKGKDLKLIISAALFEPVLYFIFEVYGIELTTASEAGLMISMIPVAVAICSIIFLKENPRKSQLFFIFLSVSGVIFMNLMKESISLSGNILGSILLIGAVLSSAGFTIRSKRATKVFTSIEVTYAMMWIGAISFNSILFINKARSGDLKSYFTPLVNIEAVIPILYLGILSSIVAFFLVNFTLSKMAATDTAGFSNLTTIISIFAGVVILKEGFYWYHIIGSILILLGVWGTIKQDKIEVKEVYEGY